MEAHYRAGDGQGGEGADPMASTDVVQIVSALQVQVRSLTDRVGAMETANAQVLDLLLEFSAGLLRVRCSLLDFDKASAESYDASSKSR